MSSKRRRGRKPMPDTERKARLIQARVDEDLDQTLRDEARKKRVSVSQLVRNVLEDTFRLVDDVVAGTASLTETVTQSARRIAASAKGQKREPPRQPPPERPRMEDVVAWQGVTVHQPIACGRCGRYLARGDQALMGLPASGVARIWLCVDCGKRI